MSNNMDFSRKFYNMIDFLGTIPKQGSYNHFSSFLNGSGFKSKEENPLGIRAK